MHFPRVRTFAGRVFVALLAAIIVTAALIPTARASGTPPLGPESFQRAAPEGFGDRGNSWAWSMAWFQNKLYVGTNRNFGCVTQLSIAAGNPSVPYPPNNASLDCPGSGVASADRLPVQAEIWSWDPTTNNWTMAFQSPLTIPMPNYPGFYAPPDIGFRTATVYTDSNNQQTMYFGGVNAQNLGFGSMPPPRLVFSKDGVTWNAVAQDPGTFMGSLQESTFRGLKEYNGQLFVINGNLQGNGPIIASNPGVDPSTGDNNWQTISPPNMTFYDMEVFNGWLYVAVLDTANGYSIYKTNAQGPPPYTFIPVVTNGAYAPAPNLSGYAISMHVFNNRLYVGTVAPPEMIRINPDDTWDLVAGPPRQVPDGTWKYPLSGFGDGFNNGFNDHFWRMGDHNGNQLFIGTYDTAIRQANTQVSNATLYQQVQPQMGFDLFSTTDGWNYTELSSSGMGNMWDYGVRNIIDTAYGMVFGTTNEYYGLDLFRSQDGMTPSITAPGHMMAEVSNGQPVLSWDVAPSAVSYQVWREPFTTANTGSSNVTFPLPPQLIATTSDPVFVDAALPSGGSYIYFVNAVDANGAVSDPSNLALVPSLSPAMTFTGALTYVQTLNSRNLFQSGQYANSQAALQQAQSLAGQGNLAAAMDQLKALNTQAQSGTMLIATLPNTSPNPSMYPSLSTPDALDVQIVLGQLMRRVKLAQAGLISPASLN